MGDMWKFANCVCSAGLAPKGVDTPEAAVIALQTGAELGLSPMASMQSIAVINKRPTIFGDAMLGVCINSGVFDHSAFAESQRGSGDSRQNACTVRRLGGAEPITRTFSVADAKKASLWGKQGPWQQYPDRMLQMRARSWALRDAFPDVLKGIYCAEEAMDIPPAQPTQVTGSRVEALAARLAGPVPEPPYDPPTPEEQAEAAPDQPSFADAASKSEPAADSQVDPDVEATDGVDPVATDEQILEYDYIDFVPSIDNKRDLLKWEHQVKADDKLPGEAEDRVLAVIKQRRTELAAK